MDSKQKKHFDDGKTAIVYIVMRVLVIAILIREATQGKWDGVVYCGLTLVLFMVPSLVERKLRIELPTVLETVVLLFIFASEILGELGAFYLKIPGWDLILHTTNGFLMAAIGFALIDVLNRSPRINMQLSTFFVAFVAFCFSMTIGVLWEFAEYSVDKFFGGDMQKDTVVSTIGSVTINPDGLNKPVWITDISETVIYGAVNGEKAEIIVDGYLDIGLHDTMEDMFVNLIGALVFSIVGAIYLHGRGQGKGQMAGAFIPRMLTEEEAEAREEQDAVRKRQRFLRFKKKQNSKSDDS